MPEEPKKHIIVDETALSIWDATLEDHSIYNTSDLADEGEPERVILDFVYRIESLILIGLKAQGDNRQQLQDAYNGAKAQRDIALTAYLAERTGRLGGKQLSNEELDQVRARADKIWEEPNGG